METPAVIRLPILRERTESWNFLDLARPALLPFIFLADSFDGLLRVRTNALGVNFPEGRVILDGFIEPGLRDRRVVHLAMPMATIADQIDDHVAAKFGSIFGGQLPNPYDCVRVLTIDVKHWNRLAFGNVGSETRRMLLWRTRGEPNEIVHDDVDRPAHRVGL